VRRYRFSEVLIQGLLFIYLLVFELFFKAFEFDLSGFALCRGC
jgi:hypothetical protein